MVIIEEMILGPSIISSMCGLIVTFLIIVTFLYSFQSGLQLSVFNIKPEHLAQQLTFLDQQYLLAMSPRELLHCERINDDRVGVRLFSCLFVR